MREIDAHALVDGARFNRFDARVLFWCGLDHRVRRLRPGRRGHRIAIDHAGHAGRADPGGPDGELGAVRDDVREHQSLPFLLDRGQVAQAQAVLARITPSYRPSGDDRLELPPQDRSGVAPIRHLFQDGRGFSMAMFWTAFFNRLDAK
jgi:hypothetical protein